MHNSAGRVAPHLDMQGEESSRRDLFWCSRVVPVPVVKKSRRRGRSGVTVSRVLLLGGIMLATLSLRLARCAARELPIGPSRSAADYSGLLSGRRASRVGRASHELVAPFPTAQRRQLHNDEEKEVTDHKSALESRSSRMVQYATRQLRRGAGVALSSVGFVSSSTFALLADTDRATWKPTVKALKEFLKTTGIDLELSKSLNGRLLRNMVLLGRVQSSIFEDRDRRDLVLQRGRHDLPSNEEAERYMRYSTAAYGDSMIAAAEMDVCGKFDSRLSRLTRAKISAHVGVPEEDIVLMDVDYGGDARHLRHFVAIDHKNKKVVLSIRGTFSLSEIVVDVAAFSRPFCGGEAHSEMANMAERVWEAAGLTVLKMLRQHKDYGFVITGHSLGAGTASLLNILCHRKGGELVDGRRTRCFAYAPPPVFTPLELVPKAVKSCTSYIHEEDAVPFLSIDSVRRCFASVGVVEKYTQKAKWLPRLKVSWGLAKPDQALLDDVAIGNTKRPAPKAGAPLLVIPCASVVWMREKGDSGKYDAKVCDPRRLATLGISVGPNMLLDHTPPRYEHAFHNLEEDDKKSR